MVIFLRRNYCIDSNQILLNEKDQQVHKMGEVCYLQLPCYIDDVNWKARG